MSYDSFIKSKKWKFTMVNLMPVVQILTLIVTAILTWSLAHSNNITSDIASNSTEATKLLKTKELCDEFEKRYWMTDYTFKCVHSKELDFVHLWTYPEWRWEINDSIKKVWEKQDKNEKLEQLYQNLELRILLTNFENAKELDKVGYLNREYFYNFFSTTVTRFLKNAKDSTFIKTNPTFIEFIDKKRGFKSEDDIDNPHIWDGFDYCLVNIFITGVPKEESERSKLFKEAWKENFSKYEQIRGYDKIELSERNKYHSKKNKSFWHRLFGKKHKKNTSSQQAVLRDCGSTPADNAV